MVGELWPRICRGSRAVDGAMLHHERLLVVVFVYRQQCENLSPAHLGRILVKTSPKLGVTV